jgi:hypothetical protein
MSAVRVTGIYTYPIKSCGGIAHERRELHARGLHGDRAWMIVRDDANYGEFVTQREFPRMALIQPVYTPDGLTISAPGMPEIHVRYDAQSARRLDVTVWKDSVRAIDQGDDIAAWVSEFLGASLRLVGFADDSRRVKHTEFTPHAFETGFADAYPLLIAAQQSLDELNRRLAERGKSTVPMQRFRPNLVLDGLDAPFDEDHWKWITIRDVRYEIAKPCARCAITTVDPQTGVIPEKGEPLATLETFRRGTDRVKGVLFGQNAIHRPPYDDSVVQVGDVVSIDERI